MRGLILLLTIFLSLLLSQYTFASKQALAIDYLYGESYLPGIRLAYRPHHSQIINFEWLGSLGLYWEVSLNFLEFGRNNQHETNYTIVLSPVFSKQLDTLYNKYPLKFELGIGV